MNQIDFTNGVLDRIAYEKAAITVLNMVKKGEKINKNIPIDTSVTVHNYEPETKQWSIEYYTRNAY